MKNYRFSKKAYEDLKLIWLYTSDKWSVNQADIYYKLIMDAIEKISKNSYLVKELKYVKGNYLFSKVKSHFIFFKILKESNEILIIRILHKKMDIVKHLDE